MNYQKIYFDLISHRRSNPLQKIRVGSKKKLYDGLYTETHHIIPVCMGGTDDEKNLIELTAREHFVAHKLLFKSYLGTKYESALGNAFWQMCYCKKDNAYKVNKSSRAFAITKQLAQLAISKSLKGRIKINNGHSMKLIKIDDVNYYIS